MSRCLAHQQGQNCCKVTEPLHFDAIILWIRFKWNTWHTEWLRPKIQEPCKIGIDLFVFLQTASYFIEGEKGAFWKQFKSRSSNSLRRKQFVNKLQSNNWWRCFGKRPKFIFGKCWKVDEISTWDLDVPFSLSWATMVDASTLTLSSWQIVWRLNCSLMEIRMEVLVPVS